MLVVAAIVAVLLGAGGYFLLFGGPGGDGGLIGGQGGGQDNTVPPFDFAMGKAAAVSTNAMRDKKLKQAAARAAQAVVAPITTLYTEAFLDPGNWREGSYDEVWAQFDAGAAEQAQTDASVLTLGTGAGDLYDTVQPGKGKLTFRVLMDDKGAPSTVLVEAKFSARAKAKDGSVTTIVSDGRYFLRDMGDGWKVISYEVTRNDQTGTEATPSSASSTPTAAAS